MNQVRDEGALQNPARRTLLAVHAHPDDEIFGTGGVFARAADAGMHTVLVVATGGEEGAVFDPEQDPAEQRARLAATRAEELRGSVDLLGIEEVYTLGYHDSGMLGTPENDNPANFLHADREEATCRVVRLLREIRPDVVVTYDERGGYGHPDHVTAHEVTVAAVKAAADPDRFPDLDLPAWSVPKFYYTASPPSVWRRIGEEMVARGLIQQPEEPEYDYDSFLTPEELITTRVDTREYVARKKAALEAHASQISQDEWLNAMPPDLLELLLGSESFIRARSSVPVPEQEDDLFAGLT